MKCKREQNQIIKLKNTSNLEKGEDVYAQFHSIPETKITQLCNPITVANGFSNTLDVVGCNGFSV